MREGLQGGGGKKKQDYTRPSCETKRTSPESKGKSGGTKKKTATFLRRIPKGKGEFKDLSDVTEKGDPSKKGGVKRNNLRPPV